MKIGRRVIAYGAGFMMGVALVSIILDFRRQREVELQESGEWYRMKASVLELPENIAETYGISGHITAAAQGLTPDAPDRKGWFFKTQSGKLGWYFINGDEPPTLYSAEFIDVYSQQGLEARLMEDGLVYQGHEVVESEPPRYRARLEAGSAIDWVQQIENLTSKSNFINRVELIPLDTVGD